MKGVYGVCIPLNLTGEFLSQKLDIENYVPIRSKAPQVYTQKRNVFSCFPSAVKALSIIDNTEFTVYSAQLKNYYTDNNIETTDERYCLIIGIQYDIQNVDKDELFDYIDETYNVSEILNKNDQFTCKNWNDGEDVRLIEIFPTKFNVITKFKGW